MNENDAELIAQVKRAAELLNAVLREMDAAGMTCNMTITNSRHRSAVHPLNSIIEIVVFGFMRPEYLDVTGDAAAYQRIEGVNT